MGIWSDYKVRRMLATDVRFARMVYEQAHNSALREASYYPSIDTKTKAGQTVMNHLNEKQNDSYKKLVIWENKSKLDIAFAKTRRQLLFAYFRAPRYMQNQEIIDSIRR